MKQVARGLYIGDLEDAGNPHLLRSHEITAVLKLTHTAPETPYPETVSVADHPLIDGPQNDIEAFRAAVYRLSTFLEEGETVFVHCSAGSSRSGAIAASALAKRENVSLETALTTIQERKPDVAPHPALLEHARHVVR